MKTLHWRCKKCLTNGRCPNCVNIESSESEEYSDDDEGSDFSFDSEADYAAQFAEDEAADSGAGSGYLVGRDENGMYEYVFDCRGPDDSSSTGSDDYLSGAQAEEFDRCMAALMSSGGDETKDSR